MPREEKLIANNKKAYHDYFVDEIFECGIELTGSEVKSLRDNRASLRESYATMRRGEVWLLGVHVAPYSHGNRSNTDPDRPRKLLLHKKEIRYLIGKTKETRLHAGAAARCTSRRTTCSRSSSVWRTARSSTTSVPTSPPRTRSATSSGRCASGRRAE